ncbi:MAG TPA: hypothetical protein VD836_11520 [Solirubrobacteraceae bacterium]|nr:hypothetical protein [Solirubrobacteraceae bacterium]
MRLKAAARRAGGAAGAGALVAEVLGGAPSRPLPPRIAAALAELEDAQRAGSRRTAPRLPAVPAAA